MIQTLEVLDVCLRPPFQKTQQDLYVCKWALISIMVYTGSWCRYMFTLPLLYLSQSLFVWSVLLSRFQPLLSSLNWNRWSINYALKYTEDQLWSTRLQRCRSPRPHLSVHLSSVLSLHSTLVCGLQEFISTLSTSRGVKRGFCFCGTLPLPSTLYRWEKSESLEI